MKAHNYRSGPLKCLAIPLLIGAFTSLVHAQTTVTLLNWDHSWNYMHPTGGVLPAGSGATEPNSGATKWYAAAADFNTSYTGPSFTTSGTGYEAGAGIGPIGYGAMDYFGTPLPAPGEFAALGTTLTTPASGSRRTGYFRTTFTVPVDSFFYVLPKIRYILDDGGFVYLDGEPVLRVNHANAADTYTSFCANTTNTEDQIRVADLSLAVGSTTGAGLNGAAGNAVVLKRITSLAPGVHTLAISVKSNNATSSDLDLAVQFNSTQSDCAIAADFSNATRNLNGTPADPTDDTITFTLNVTPTGSVSPSGWTITSPASVAPLTGAYSTGVSITAPIAEFAAGTMTLAIADAGTPACNTTLNVVPQRIIGTNDTVTAGSPVVSTGVLPVGVAAPPNGGWVFDDSTRSASMNNAGGGARKVYQSGVIDLSSVGATQFTGELVIDDTSTGTEAADSFVASLIIDGNTASPVNLILPHDTITPDGVLTDDELAPAGGSFTRAMSYIIPASANSVQIVIEGINDSNNEKFTVRNLLLGAAPPTLQAIAGAVTYNNQGSTDPLDDTISAPVTIDPINLGASTGWTSTGTPASGLYSTPNPVTFGPFPAASSPVSVTLSDVGNPAIQASITLTAPARTFTVSAPANIVRNENGPGIADDTVSFDVTVAGTNGGPGWNITTPGVTPASGAFGTVTLTVGAPLPASPLAVAFEDSSYAASTQTVNVALPGRYVIGQTNFGTAADLITDLSVTPSALWVNDSLARTLTISAGVNAQTETVLSQVINLSSVGDVQFSAAFAVNDTSAGSNMDLPDKFKAELIIDGGLGSEQIVNLVTAFDSGDGLSAVPFVAGLPVPNGPADGWINGYTGTASAADGFAAALDEYNAHIIRDEFNRNAQPGAESMAATFNFSHLIPAAATTVQLRIQSQGINGSENATLSNILFALGVADSDGDGMDDGYEDANGLDKNNAGDKFLDLDGDGQSNYAEFISGTTANNPLSVLALTAVSFDSTSGDYSLTWNSVAGKTYRVEVSPTMAAGTWVTLGSVPATGASTTTTGTYPGPIPGRLFVRVSVP